MSDDAGILLVAGLGNPGERYERTRHNAGFWFVDRVASQYHGTFCRESRFFGEVCRVDVAGVAVRLLKPATMMNRSGQSVCAMASYFDVPSERILVVHDEIDLPPGTSRLKRGGGHGGHNGLRDIISCLGKSFWRLRLGVGHPGHRDQVVNYVLSRASRGEEDIILDDVDEALALMPQLSAGDMERAMHCLHTMDT
ncbi:MAG: aminoacyl-tRNA hydrolase [Pseudomonadota bacterium]|nr:aminoacyl-tRNA hydrolase [Pseudomonadota bacterium]